MNTSAVMTAARTALRAIPVSYTHLDVYKRQESPIAKEAQEGVKGGTLAGGSPFAGGLSLSLIHI